MGCGLWIVTCGLRVGEPSDYIRRYVQRVDTVGIDIGGHMYRQACVARMWQLPRHPRFFSSSLTWSFPVPWAASHASRCGCGLVRGKTKCLGGGRIEGKMDRAVVIWGLTI